MSRVTVENAHKRYNTMSEWMGDLELQYQHLGAELKRARTFMRDMNYEDEELVAPWLMPCDKEEFEDYLEEFPVSITLHEISQYFSLSNAQLQSLPKLLRSYGWRATDSRKKFGRQRVRVWVRKNPISLDDDA